MDRIIHLQNENLPEIMQLLNDVIRDMDNKNIPQWDEIYPDQQTIENDINEQTLYGLWIENTLAGIMAVNEFQDKEYNEVNWAVDDPKPLVVHRLCISPDFQRRGFARLMMEFAENYARNKNYISIRLDAFIKNPASVALYKNMGYQERGTVTFRKGDFYCFEKKL